MPYMHTPKSNNKPLSVPARIFSIPSEFRSIKTDGFFPGGVFSLKAAVKNLVHRTAK